MLKYIYPFITIFFLFNSSWLHSQQFSSEQIKKQIELYKQDPRGPYNRIRWFCKDGTIREPKDPCPDSIGGGVQHASYKTDVIKLGERNHIYLGEILTPTDKSEFWDEKNNHSRIKQYQLNQYLASIDDGWVLQKAQYYRGAVQSEDEQAWGLEFYNWLLKNNEALGKYYFLIRQSLKDIPHDGDDNLAQLMRSQSKTIADEFPEFMDVRIKIHGKPDRTDITLVKNFQKEHNEDLTPELKKQFDRLDNTLQKFYAPINFEKLKNQARQISETNDITKNVLTFLNEYNNSDSPDIIVPALAELLYDIRNNITSLKKGKDKLLLLDLSNEFENILLRKTQEWKTATVNDALYKICNLSYAAAGTGLIESWEWNKIKPSLTNPLGKDEAQLSELNDFLSTSRSIIEWSAATVKANYEDVVNAYVQFEPKSYGFIDDRVRSTVALDLGETVNKLGSFISEQSSLKNNVMNISSQSTIRGLNPGYAYGELVVVKGNPENTEVDNNKIYIFQRPPSDLKPVAGIMTVAEGNLVSHVQLLARNLGIPNAALSDDNLKSLEKYNGKKVFYAVSDKGNVVLKSESDMSDAEKDLFTVKEAQKNMVEVPVNQIRLDVNEILNMRNVGADDSGKLCGPKAANLGELKAMFPNHVVEGLVIPFGIFRKHMDQDMPGKNMSYWTFLNATFTEADKMRKNNIKEKEIENFQLRKLETLRNAIIQMPLEKEFINQLKDKFKSVFGNSIGKVPVFLRSDTNMEDLKEFTGAGLNLTLFNIVSEDDIINGIKRVWASPYTERSFKWRQKYLLNPENVFPSILIIPSVDVEYSGVMITKGINIGTDNDLTVAFSRGAGGAVDGQAAETWLVTENSSLLLAPARQPDYIRLPLEGGTTKKRATFETSILNKKNIADLRSIAQTIRLTLPQKTHSDYKGAYDVELGFKDDKIWLFQIRPFVENKRAKSSEYLSSISPSANNNKTISLKNRI
ncbi:PEP/pyruvate-binding domain-containing protein [Abyssalbus ytuae]|uniref:Phosphoenolpyruvate synthase n=1 Tax=Abyssalbus ytuae TaxID=2926907 RepID=A0A9E6ZLC9_9FLAO|nr:PEP/pyruvate-binding domain-containing protein [Abyssalbus ytuae]UOB17909.1 PEP/pyruvate-binding domain-containing protein [Abyssalbus ytuae]